MNEFPKDIYTEPREIDVNTINNLGPLTKMASIWTGQRGLDLKPKAEGPKKQTFVEKIELQPIDPVTNGPQLLYGLRYYTHITKPDQIKTYHEQVVNKNCRTNAQSTCTKKLIPASRCT